MVHDVLDGITTTDMHECLLVFASLGLPGQLVFDYCSGASASPWQLWHVSVS